MSVELKNISVKLGNKIIYENFNLNIEENKILCILGESGEGKTTLLNVISNLIDYQGEVKNDLKTSVVFQENRLIDTMTVSENLSFICGEKDFDNDLKRLGLYEYKDKYINTLSGGQKRRVAIYRGLKYDAKLLLMDEPFNSLDIKLKNDLIEFIKERNKKDKKTIVFITHDIFEGVNLADRIVLIKKGKIVLDINKITKDTVNEIYGFMAKNKE